MTERERQMREGEREINGKGNKGDRGNSLKRPYSYVKYATEAKL